MVDVVDMKDNLFLISKEYQNRTYDYLSSEFQKVQPYVVRAFELIGLMYNRLTIVDKFSHKEAVAKIQNDHKHLPGFSERNIRRYLPLDNPSVPRRVRSQCPKNSVVETNEPSKLSDTLTYNNADHKKTYRVVAIKQPAKPTECTSCVELSLENNELREALEKTRQLTTADKIVSAAVDCSHNKEEQFEVLPFEFSLSKKEIMDSWGEVYLEIADADMQVWFTGKIDTKNRRVISAGIGRSQQGIDSNNAGETQ
jgi:hypothetical protein